LIATIDLWSTEQFVPLPDAEVEKMLLKKVTGANREGKILKLQTATGVIKFEDRLGVGEGSINYYLAGFRNKPKCFYLVRIIGHESKGYVMVSKNIGQSIDLYGVPVFSPDGKRFVDCSLDLEAGYMPNLIRIYQLKNNKYAVKWKYKYPGMNGPSDPVWLNNSTVVFFEVTVNNESSSPRLTKKPQIIEWKNGKWNLPRSLN
jgi:hypothetical protein